MLKGRVTYPTAAGPTHLPRFGGHGHELDGAPAGREAGIQGPDVRRRRWR